MKKLDFYLFHAKNSLETTFKHYDIRKELNLNDEEYILSLKTNGVDIKTGFFWDIGDVYFGVKIKIPREDSDKLFTLKDEFLTRKWGFSREVTSTILSKQRRLANNIYHFQGLQHQHKKFLGYFSKDIEEAKYYIDKIQSKEV